jgi:hypothetical protein
VETSVEGACRMSTTSITDGAGYMKPRASGEYAAKQTTWPLVREPTIPTVRPPFVEIWCQLLWTEG